jgi:hypothetical protein
MKMSRTVCVHYEIFIIHIENVGGKKNSQV